MTSLLDAEGTESRGYVYRMTQSLAATIAMIRVMEDMKEYSLCSFQKKKKILGVGARGLMRPFVNIET